MDQFQEILNRYLAARPPQETAYPPAMRQAARDAEEQPPALPPVPAVPVQPIRPDSQPDSEFLPNDEYLNAILQKLVGHKVQVEFLIGTNTLLDRSGYLLEVGANYLILNELETDDLLICDFYTVKFVRVYL